MQRERVIAIFTPAGERRVQQALHGRLERDPDSFPYGLLTPIHRDEDLKGFADVTTRRATEASSDSRDDKPATQPEKCDRLLPSRLQFSSDATNPALARAQAIQAYVFYLIVDGLAKRSPLASDHGLLVSPSDEALAQLRSLSPAVLRSAISQTLADID